MQYLFYASIIGLALACTTATEPTNSEDTLLMDIPSQNTSASYSNRDTIRKVGSFDALSVRGAYSVVIKKSNEEKVQIISKRTDLSNIITEVDGSTLKVYNKKNSSWNWNSDDEEDIKIIVHYKELNKVALSGSSDLEVENTLKADNFTLTVSGSSDIKGEFSIKNDFSITISGSAEALLSGASKLLNLTVSGSGEIDARQLKTENAEATVSGSGEIKVVASESIKARVSGSGDITYGGNPKQVDVKTSGSGSIRKI